MSNISPSDDEIIEYLEMELERKRALKAGYVNSGVPKNGNHHRWLREFEAAGGPLSSEPGFSFKAGQPSVPPTPTTQVRAHQSVLNTQG